MAPRIEEIDADHRIRARWFFHTIVGLVLAFGLAGCGTAIGGGPAATQVQTATLLVATASPVGGVFATPVIGPFIDPLLKSLDTATPTVTATATRTGTATATATATATRTPLPTFTLPPTATATVTQTPRPSLTPFPSETPAPVRPAQLFTRYDADGKLIDWSYARITDIRWDANNRPVRMSASLSFQLLDRAIHRKTIQVLGKDLTVYYLNAQHEFNGAVRPVELIVDGEWGSDVPLRNLTSSGSFYVSTLVLEPGARVDPYNIHAQSIKDYPDRLETYQANTLIAELEATLATLPDELIVLADHPVVVSYTAFEDVQYYLTATAFQAARYFPWVSLNPLDKVTGVSPQALAWAEYIWHGAAMPDGPLTYSSNVLVLIPGSAP